MPRIRRTPTREVLAKDLQPGMVVRFPTSGEHQVVSATLVETPDHRLVSVRWPNGTNGTFSSTYAFRVLK